MAEPAAWLGTLFMGGQSLLFYATLAWLAAAVHRPRPYQLAGLLLAVFSAAQLVTALAMPVLAHRAGALRPWIAVSSGYRAGLLLVAFAPIAFGARPGSGPSLLGLGMGGNLALALPC